MAYGKEVVCPLEAPKVGQLKAHCFPIGVVTLHLPCQLLLPCGKPLDSGVDGFLGGLNLGEGGEEAFSVKLLIFRMEPEPVYWGPDSSPDSSKRPARSHTAIFIRIVTEFVFDIFSK